MFEKMSILREMSVFVLNRALNGYWQKLLNGSTIIKQRIGMESKSGIKDCPRCGLRNRLSSVTCDFCGYRFERAVDGLEDSLDSLIEMSRETAVAEERDLVSEKILSTLRRPEELGHKDASAEISDVEPTAPGSFVVDDEDDMMVASTLRTSAAIGASLASRQADAPEIVDDRQGRGSVEKIDEASTITVDDGTEPSNEVDELIPLEIETAKTPSQEDSVVISTLVASESLSSEPAMEDGTIDIDAPTKLDEDVAEASVSADMMDTGPGPQALVSPTAPLAAGERASAVSKSDDHIGKEAIRGSITMARDRERVRTWLPLASGLIIYVISIGASMADIGNQISSWGGVALGSILIAAGLFRLSGQWFIGPVASVGMILTDMEDEVEYVCPGCQEIVSSEEDTCPNCSSRFEVE